MVFNDVEFLVGDFKLNFQGEPENMGTKKEWNAILIYNDITGMMIYSSFIHTLISILPGNSWSQLDCTIGDGLKWLKRRGVSILGTRNFAIPCSRFLCGPRCCRFMQVLLVWPSFTFYFGDLVGRNHGFPQPAGRDLVLVQDCRWWVAWKGVAVACGSWKGWT